MTGTKKVFQSFYYGWFIVFIGGLGLFFSGPGQTYSNSAFIDQYINDFGWSRTEVSSLYSTATLVAGLTMMFVGRFIDRYGQRLMMVTVGTGFAIACFFNSMVSNMFMLAIGFFFVRLLGQGTMSLIPNTLVAQWFVKKRGRAFSFMTIGSFISAMLFPIINTWLIQTWDWQMAWRFWGVALLIVFVPFALFGVRNKPEEMGLEPDGTKTPKNEALVDTTDLPESEEDWTLKEAMRTWAFWGILISVGIPAMVNTGITFHIISIFDTNGLSPGVAAMVLSLMAFVGMPMSFVSGFITEKVPTNYLLASVFLIEIIFLLLLLITDNMLMAVVFGVIWGAANGLERIGMNVIWPDFFGRKYVGSINGVGMTMVVIGSSLGPLPFGAGFDIFHDYTPVLLVTLIFPLIGLICAVTARRPNKRKLQIN
ncbi:Sugar phosphate permease [Lentibacillus persicus]|uniref:Sugar phosphate permease n=1 Tax=Lentibacillus persicus TaxID=640948 RepID=A0A1I1UE97_9BACI|nr:MFS transporter [Lentibacillus persicus]SFD69151.1 Sugar phosphate permease [Lentibacillus persicus]